MEGLVRVPVREQEPKVRATNFEEVCYGYNEEEAVAEASRCLNCKNAQCMKGCPVSINIPAFIAQVKERNFEEAYHIISESSALPAVCGRVCPQESQCEGKCIRGFKGDPGLIHSGFSTGHRRFSTEVASLMISASFTASSSVPHKTI